MEEKYGEVEEMNVCDNLGDHLVGNVYVKVRGAAPDRLGVGVRGCGGVGEGGARGRRHPPCRPRPASSWLPGLGGGGCCAGSVPFAWILTKPPLPAHVVVVAPLPGRVGKPVSGTASSGAWV